MCALVAAALAWPMPLHPSEVAIGGATGDFASVAWGLWARPMGHLKEIGFPAGGVLVVSDPPEVWALAPVTILFGPVVAFNLWQLLHVGLAGGLTFALARRSASRAGAACAAAIFAFSGVMLGAIHNGNADVTPLYWLPAVALLAHRPWLAGAAAGVGAWCNPYVGVGCAVLLVFRVDWRQWWKAAIPAAGLAGSYLALMKWSLAAPGSVVIKATDAPGAGASLKHLFWATPPVADGQGTIDFYYLGLAALALALLGFKRDRWLGVFVLGLTFAMGKYLVLDGEPWLVNGTRLQLPMRWLADLPGFDGLQLHYRYIAMATLPLAIWGARGVDRLPVQARTFALGLILVDQLRFGAGLLEGGEVYDSGACEALEGLAEGPVVNHPGRFDEQWLLEQTCHGRPIAATINRLPAPKLKAAEEGDTDTLKRLGFKWLVLHVDGGIAVIEL